jgi:5-methylcytosine-specific restriction endonuclease McrA
MSRTKITIVGGLRLSKEEGLRYSLPIGKPSKTIWLEVLPNASEWPGLTAPKWLANEEFPERRKGKVAEEDWRRATEAYWQAVHTDTTYQKEASEFVERQRGKPQFLPTAPFSGSITFWVYRDKILSLESTDPEIIFRKETGTSQIQEKAIILMKHHVLRRERHYERVRREVEALENIEKLEGLPREPIPEDVRLFVWQRDKGRCVKCGSRERLEFDHIIPVTAGGSSTERNIQLLCESCNRSKGSTI